jgi:hypothetical protein
MVWMNKTPFKLSLNSKGNDRIAHRKVTTAPLATIFEGDNDKVYPFTRAFAARIESVGIKTHLTEGHVRGFTSDTATQKHANMTWAQTVASSEVFSDF